MLNETCFLVQYQQLFAQSNRLNQPFLLINFSHVGWCRTATNLMWQNSSWYKRIDSVQREASRLFNQWTRDDKIDRFSIKKIRTHIPMSFVTIWICLLNVEIVDCVRTLYLYHQDYLDNIRFHLSFQLNVKQIIIYRNNN